jgi:hypothetical protein
VFFSVSQILRHNAFQQLTEIIVHVVIVIGNIQTDHSFISYNIRILFFNSSDVLLFHAEYDICPAE